MHTHVEVFNGGPGKNAQEVINLQKQAGVVTNCADKSLLLSKLCHHFSRLFHDSQEEENRLFILSSKTLPFVLAPPIRLPLKPGNKQRVSAFVYEEKKNLLTLCCMFLMHASFYLRASKKAIRQDSRDLCRSFRKKEQMSSINLTSKNCKVCKNSLSQNQKLT